MVEGQGSVVDVRGNKVSGTNKVATNENSFNAEHRIGVNGDRHLTINISNTQESFSRSNDRILPVAVPHAADNEQHEMTELRNHATNANEAVDRRTGKPHWSLAAIKKYPIPAVLVLVIIVSAVILVPVMLLVVKPGDESSNKSILQGATVSIV
jgi:hypothetical protein